MSESAPTSSEDPVAEWLYLSDRAQQIYGGLVGLSDFGHWDSYFSRTFDIYTRLWRFQQQHRAVLESKDAYGLQRWEIGDIAARIGQLYYHYYLRTSDVGYLQEAYLFYDAVRTRSYYKFVGDKNKSSLIGLLVKQLRFYARFIVTCLLMDRRNMVSTLVEEMSHVINEYSTATRGAGETQEWHLVLQEISLFLQEDITVNLKQADFKPQPRRSIFPVRSASLSPSIPSGGNGSPTMPALRLQSCILVGCHQHQVKFSELTLDMYRMMYALERDPSSSSSPPTQGPLTGSGGGTTPRSKARANVTGNPKKYLLYRPTVSQVLLYLVSAQRELLDQGTLMLYISADGEAAKSIGSGSSASTPAGGATVPPASPASLVASSGSSITPSPAAGFYSSSIASSNSSLVGYHSGGAAICEPYSTGGVRLKREEVLPSSAGSSALSARRNSAGKDVRPGSSASSSTASTANTVAKASSYVSTSALFPADLVPFTRRPTFIIVESDNSHAFLSLGNAGISSPFAVPLLVLCSPQETPTDVLEGSQAGGLFTFYLHDPLAAFLFTSNKSISSLDVYNRALALVKSIVLAIDELFGSVTDLPVSLAQFLSDEFMRMLLVRFCFCYYALKLRVSKELTADCLPASYPALSASILANANIAAMFKQLAEAVGVSNLYR